MELEGSIIGEVIFLWPFFKQYIAVAIHNVTYIKATFILLFILNRLGLFQNACCSHGRSFSNVTSRNGFSGARSRPWPEAGTLPALELESHYSSDVLTWLDFLTRRIADFSVAGLCLYFSKRVYEDAVAWAASRLATIVPENGLTQCRLAAHLWHRHICVPRDL